MTELGTGPLMTEPSIAVVRDIAATAGRIFSILACPSDHPDVDGTGMLRTARAEGVISKVGDVFTMNMCNDEMGEYVMENTVVEFDPDRRIAWEPVMRSIGNPEFQAGVGEPAHHQWGWQLEPLGAGVTRVTEFFDCSRSPDWLREATKDGEGWRSGIEASLDKLEGLVAGG